MEVDDVDAALECYSRIFDFTLRGRGKAMAFIDMTDPFIAIEEKRTPGKSQREPKTAPNGKTLLKHSDISKAPHRDSDPC